MIDSLLKTASEDAIKTVAYNKAYHAQLMLVDKKTKLICLSFLNKPTMEPEERELLSEELMRLQKIRSSIVTNVLNLNLML